MVIHPEVHGGRDQGDSRIGIVWSYGIIKVGIGIQGKECLIEEANDVHILWRTNV